MLSARRGAKLSNSWTFKTCCWTYSIGHKLKQTKPRHELEFPGYPSDTSLCVVVIIKEYLERTKHFRKGITSLFVTYVKPYKAATKSTISR